MHDLRAGTTRCSLSEFINRAIAFPEPLPPLELQASFLTSALDIIIVSRLPLFQKIFV